MRGKDDGQSGMFYVIDLEERVRADHPLRAIKGRVEGELAKMSRLFNAIYSEHGRPSVPPERLLKAMLLQALYSIRSERQLVERIDTDLLFRWFLGMDPAEEAFHATAFTHNRDRLAEHGIPQRFFDGVVKQAVREGLTSDDHFSVDGTLIQSHASLKSLKTIGEDNNKSDGDAGGAAPGAGVDEPRKSRNESVDFRGEKRRNATHRSTTDPEARLYRKGAGQPALLSHSGHAITENRHGLIVAVAVDEANGKAERRATLAMLDHLKKRHKIEPLTLGADKGYDDGVFLLELEKRVADPHVAIRSGPIRGEDDGSWMRKWLRKRSKLKGPAMSQRRRKLIEEAFGWIKSVAGLRRTRLVGRWKLAIQVHMAAAAYNLVRMTKLAA